MPRSVLVHGVAASPKTPPVSILDFILEGCFSLMNPSRPQLPTLGVVHSSTSKSKGRLSGCLGGRPSNVVRDALRVLEAAHCGRKGRRGLQGQRRCDRSSASMSSNRVSEP
eukprot:571370_1